MKQQNIQTGRVGLRGELAAALLTITLLAAARPAAAQSIYRTGFEPDTFLVDTTLVGQDGWVAPPPLSPNAAVVTADKPRQGKQTVHLLGEDLVPQDFILEATGGYYQAIGSYRRAVDYDTGGSQAVRISANVRLDGRRTAAGDDFFSASIAGRAESVFEGEPSSASVGELAISSDGRAYVYSGNDSVPTFLASQRVTLGAWHNLAIIADFGTQTSRFYVDGQLLAVIAWEPSEEYTGVLLRGALLAYAAPDTATNTKANYVAHYDQFSIKVIRRHDCEEDRDERDERSGPEKD